MYLYCTFIFVVAIYKYYFSVYIAYEEQVVAEEHKDGNREGREGQEKAPAYTR